MASTKIKVAVAVALVAALSVPLALQHRTNQRLLAEVNALRRQGAEIAQLRDAFQRVSTEARSLTEQNEKDRAELARLRGDLAAAKARQSSEGSGQCQHSGG
jgi:hypothetical protein